MTPFWDRLWDSLVSLNIWESHWLPGLGDPGVRIWRLPGSCQAISLGDSPPLTLGTSHRLHLVIESLLFLAQVAIPGHDLHRQELRCLVVYRSLSGKKVSPGLIKVPSVFCDIIELCLIEWVQKPPFRETALWGEFWLVG